ncbi:MAG: hypothetical protein KF746_02845 [Chitinophagaceae bacterium]|nr:hypothetical protein [Chitinophagaceae bacterium]
MRSKTLILASLFIFSLAAALKAQKGNPYKDIGKKGEILTLTKGEFEEFFDEEDIQQIGTNLVNIRTMKVVKVLTEEEAGKRLDNTTGKRFLSVDPLTTKYPELTPYQFASNRPIDGIDLDGRENYNYKLAKLDDNTTKLTLTSVESAKPWYGGAEYSHHHIYYNGTTYHFNGTSIDPFANSFRSLILFLNDPDKAIKAGLVKSKDDQIVDWVIYNLQQEVFELASANTTFAVRNNIVSSYRANVGESSTNDYRGIFFEANPELRGQVIVHHGVEQQIEKRYPGAFTTSQVNSLENLRGINLSDNNVLHLSLIRRVWNAFYKDNPQATVDQILEQATKIDKDYGHLFNPQLNTSTSTFAESKGGFNFSRGLILLAGLEDKEDKSEKK